MPDMQEHFPAMAMDGRYAGNAGAIAGKRLQKITAFIAADPPSVRIALALALMAVLASRTSAAR